MDIAEELQRLTDVVEEATDDLVRFTDAQALVALVAAYSIDPDPDTLAAIKHLRRWLTREVNQRAEEHRKNTRAQSGEG